MLFRFPSKTAPPFPVPYKESRAVGQRRPWLKTCVFPWLRIAGGSETNLPPPPHIMGISCQFPGPFHGTQLDASSGRS